MQAPMIGLPAITFGPRDGCLVTTTQPMSKFESLIDGGLLLMKAEPIWAKYEDNVVTIKCKHHMTNEESQSVRH